jgi:hypothetical protein
LLVKPVGVYFPNRVPLTSVTLCAFKVLLDPLTKDKHDTWKVHVEAMMVKNDTWMYVDGSSVKPEPTPTNAAVVDPGKNEQQCFYSTLPCSSDVLTIHFYYSSVVIMKFYYSVSVKCVADTLIVFN